MILRSAHLASLGLDGERMRSATRSVASVRPTNRAPCGPSNSSTHRRLPDWVEAVMAIARPVRRIRRSFESHCIAVWRLLSARLLTLAGP